MTGVSGRSSKLFARVADAGKSGIADHRQAVACCQQFEQLGQAGSGVVLMEGQAAASRLEVAEQLAAVARVFTGDHIDCREQGLGPG